MEPKKIIGWVLIIAGLLLIFWTLYSTYNIFTGKKMMPEIFKVEKEKQVSSGEEIKKNIISQKELEDEMKKIVQEQVKDIVPSEFLSRIFNLTSWSILAFILVFGGSTISGIGIKLLRRK